MAPVPPSRAAARSILVTGLYELSRLQARGLTPTLPDAITAWRRGTRPTARNAPSTPVEE